MEVTLRFDQADDPPPMCPRCTFGDQHHYGDGRMQQEFKPFAIGGSPRSKAEALTEDIMANDYHVANAHRDRHEGMIPKVRYKDQTAPQVASQWTVANEALTTAMAAGRRNRLQHGSGLDILQANLKSGAEPDLIAASKKRMIKLY